MSWHARHLLRLRSWHALCAEQHRWLDAYDTEDRLRDLARWLIAQ